MVSQINVGIKELNKSIQDLGVGMGKGHWDQQSMEKQMKVYINDKKDTIDVCQCVAKELSLTSIQEAIDSQKK